MKLVNANAKISIVAVKRFIIFLEIFMFPISSFWIFLRDFWSCLKLYETISTVFHYTT